MDALWVLNLDAEEELERPDGYNPTVKVTESVEALAQRAMALLGPGDERLVEGRMPRRGLVGRAWCPTPRALRLLRRAGAVPEPAPELAVLQRVNHRRFCFELGAGLPNCVFCDSGAEALGELERLAHEGPWLVKRAFGFAGRGQRRITAEPFADDRRWLSSARNRHGVLIEPLVAVTREFAVHGSLPQSGDPAFGRICEQICDDNRAWQETRLAANVAPRTVERLEAEARRVAAALRAAGYFGPFGIDAYEYRDDNGVIRLNPLSEINARYTMGYAIGMGSA